MQDRSEAETLQVLHLIILYSRGAVCVDESGTLGLSSYLQF